MEYKKRHEKTVKVFVDRELKYIENKAEQKRSKKILVRISFLLLFSFLALYLYSNYKSTYLKKNGIISNAIVINIIHNSYRMNDMDGTYVNNYKVEFEFTTNKEIIKSFYEIRTDIYNQYFETRLKLNDTIKIRYNPKNPRENEIIKIK